MENPSDIIQDALIQRLDRVGYKEIEEVLTALVEVSDVLIDLFKDGVQFSDFTKLWHRITEDEEFKHVLHRAYEGYKEIPREIEDLDTEEVLMLGSMFLSLLPKVLNNLKLRK